MSHDRQGAGARLSHEELLRRAEAYREHGTLVKAATALGIKKWHSTKASSGRRNWGCWVRRRRCRASRIYGRRPWLSPCRHLRWR
ncbi:hypothetical protein DR92_2028 [Brucella anthropi]|nr:hypothetical protein DR92_2028 [Brucella anthropi]